MGSRVGRIVVGACVVLVVALLSGVVAQVWYRTVEQGEQEADQRGAQQVAALLLRRIERERGQDLAEVLADFDVVVDSHVAVVSRGQVLASAGTPAWVQIVLRDLREPGVLEVRRRRIEREGTSYEVFGGQSSHGPSGYLILPAMAPARATMLRPAFIAGWIATVVLAAAAAFMVGRARAAGDRRARDRERSLTSAIAHEIRTPLGAIVTAAGLLEAEVNAMPSSARRPAELLVDEIERLRSLVEELLALARLEAGDHEMHVEVVPLARIVTDDLSERGAGRRRGLGLRIAQEDAALHGTRITASKDPSSGTTLELRLPTVAGIEGA